MKATKNFSVSDWCGNFEVTFQGEQGNEIYLADFCFEEYSLINRAIFFPFQVLIGVAFVVNGLN